MEKFSDRKIHAIQLKSIMVRELTFKRFKAIQGTIETCCKILNGTAKHASDSDIIKTGIKCECIGGTEEDPFFTLTVDLLGDFQIDQGRFPIEKIENWQEENAPFIMLPYLREQVYSLSIKGGIQPIVLPMYEIPTTRSNREKIEKANEEKG